VKLQALPLKSLLLKRMKPVRILKLQVTRVPSIPEVAAPQNAR